MKKIISLLLALVMLASVASVAANAASASTVKQYKKYAFFGDSIAAGFSMPDYNAHGEYVWPRQNIAGSYPNILSKAVQATSTYGGKTYSMAAPGFRTEELHMLLTNNYAGDTITKKYVGELASASKSAGYDYDNLITWRADYQSAAKNADLITLDIGLNDTWLPLSALSLMWRDTGTGATDATQAIAYALQKYGTIGNVISEGMGALVHLVTMPQFVAYLVEDLSALITGFYTHYDAIVDAIYKLNPDVTLVHVGSYNSFATWKDFPLLGTLLQPTYTMMNNHKQQLAKKHNNSYYVDMTGIPLITNSLADAIDTSSGTLIITYNPHPTALGHQEMANRILEVLPTGPRSTKKTTNYPTLTKVGGKWAYRVNGKVQTSYNGFGESQYGVYYVKKGVVDFSVTGIVNVNGSKYYVKQNKLQTTYVGMVKAGSTTYYVKNGVVQGGYTGIVNSNGVQYYVKAGVVQTSYTGVVKGSKNSYYVKNGKVDTSFSGTKTSGTKIYTIKNGIVTAVKNK